MRERSTKSQPQWKIKEYATAKGKIYVTAIAQFWRVYSHTSAQQSCASKRGKNSGHENQTEQTQKHIKPKEKKFLVCWKWVLCNQKIDLLGEMGGGGVNTKLIVEHRMGCVPCTWIYSAKVKRDGLDNRKAKHCTNKRLTKRWDVP